MVKMFTLSLTLAMTAMICQPSRGGEPTCGADSQTACRGAACPHCGCGLVPTCHIQCATKKVIEYKYGCTCGDICIPGVTPVCKRCGSYDGSGECCGAADTCNNGCPECCGERCVVRQTRKLVKYPVTKEVPVKKCSVQWVCPQCNCHANCTEDAAPAAPTTPATPAIPTAPTPPSPSA